VEPITEFGVFCTELPGSRTVRSRIAGERMYLWNAVDDEGEVLDMLVPTQTRQSGGATAERRTAPESDLTGPPPAMQRRHRDDSRWAFPLAAPHSDIAPEEALASRPKKAELCVEKRDRIGGYRAGRAICPRVRQVRIAGR
jgi:hypothetical protein